METSDHILDGTKRGYFSKEEAAKLQVLDKRAFTATSRLLRDLDSCDGRPPTGWDHP
jgi:hypothetical protein